VSYFFYARRMLLFRNKVKYIKNLLYVFFRIYILWNEQRCLIFTHITDSFNGRTIYEWQKAPCEHLFVIHMALFCFINFSNAELAYDYEIF